MRELALQGWGTCRKYERHMIKFFRHIRQRLLSESKFSKYLVYAIGEIVLVVIGILIALQINNWNQERINRSRSNGLLQGMVKDLSQDIAALDRTIGYYKSRLAFFERHLTKTDFTTTSTDTLFLLMDGSSIPFSVTDLSYEKAKNLGISQLCSDDSLALRINEYYTQTMEFNKIIATYEFEELSKDNHYWLKDQEGIEVDYNISFHIPIIQDSIQRRDNAIAALLSPKGRNYIKSECYGKERLLELQNRNREIVRGLREDIMEYLDQER